MNGITARRYFILSIWSEPSDVEPEIWRGYVETPNGTRTYFATIERLADLLQDMGWRQDTTHLSNSNRRNLFKTES
ncbi:MAG: hypothetical protein DHS20C20_25310 [Ardenticatenaceae bacterium]|nr:MAG: hypothetical protein DHS20C20_25310 [Ardenticatenaceae bacterium]